VFFIGTLYHLVEHRGLSCVEFIAAMADAKAGSPNVPALQGCLTNIATATTSLTSADWAEIGLLLEESNLSGVFQLPSS
jgi:hypothetical protein